jgi:hypothetical protein
MSLYFFRISHGRYSGASDQGSEFESRDAAWAEMTKACGNLVGSISRSLKQNAEWHMELLDEARKPVFRIRLGRRRWFRPRPLVSALVTIPKAGAITALLTADSVPPILSSKRALNDCDTRCVRIARQYRSISVFLPSRN